MNILLGKDFDQIESIAKSLLSEGLMTYSPDFGVMKALDATTTTSMTDLAQLTGGRAITIENIDADLKSTIADQSELLLWNLFRHSPIYAVLDQYMMLTNEGQIGKRHSAGVFTSEAAFPVSKDVTLKRKVDTTKFLRDMRDLTHVLEVAKTMAEKHTLLNKAGAMTVLTANEKCTIHGDSDVIPNEFDGLLKKINTAYAAGYDVVIDVRKTGASSNSEGGSLTEPDLDEGARKVRNGLGAATHLILPNLIQSDLNQILPVGRRVNIGGGMKLNLNELMGGVPMVGFQTGFGFNGWGDGTIPHFKFAPHIERFFPSGESDDVKAPTVKIGTNPTAPVAAGIVLLEVVDGSSKFGAGDLGDYFYCVSAINADGESVATAADAGAATLATAGKKIRLTITGADALITGYSIYRSAKDAADATDCRWIKDVKCTNVAGDTVVYDLNENLPGTSQAILVSNAPATGAIDYRQLLPFVRIPLAFGLNNIVGFPYLYMLYHYLRIAKMENEQTGYGYHLLFRNIRHSGSTF